MTPLFVAIKVTTDLWIVVAVVGVLAGDFDEVDV